MLLSLRAPQCQAFRALPPREAPAQPGLVPASHTLSAAELHRAIDQLVAAIVARHGERPRVLLLGIANGGLELNRRLGARLGAPTGTLDISFHRDDIGRNPIPKEFAPTIIPVDVTGATVILVDDVLFSGRTVKAALDELFDHGRPSAVELAVLIDRGGRKLPLAPDYCGLTLDPTPQQKVVVRLDEQDPARDTASVIAARRPAH
jgi:pyrimidine operon attenuation protein / uracil phosphoribosyltransferase